MAGFPGRLSLGQYRTKSGSGEFACSCDAPEERTFSATCLYHSPQVFTSSHQNNYATTVHFTSKHLFATKTFQIALSQHAVSSSAESGQIVFYGLTSWALTRRPCLCQSTFTDAELSAAMVEFVESTF
jgi:hypothetical protein